MNSIYISASTMDEGLAIGFANALCREGFTASVSIYEDRSFEESVAFALDANFSRMSVFVHITSADAQMEQKFVLKALRAKEVNVPVIVLCLPGRAVPDKLKACPVFRFKPVADMDLNVFLFCRWVMLMVEDNEPDGQPSKRKAPSQLQSYIPAPQLQSYIPAPQQEEPEETPVVPMWSGIPSAVAPAGGLFGFLGGLVTEKAASRRNKRLTISSVQFSAVVPTRFIMGEYAIINVVAFEQAYRKIVDTLLAADDTNREVVSGVHSVREGMKIRIELSSPDLALTDAVEEQQWDGKYLVFSFDVNIPGDYKKKQALFTATVFLDGVIATRLKFVVECTTIKDQKLNLLRQDVLTAFMSYASQDRQRVAGLIQGMKKVRPEMDIFFDVESLRSGDDWQQKIRHEIVSRDVLFLCWSENAKRSPWVENEWRYALEQKGLEAIEPIPLVPPAQCPPPQELNAKHFNDKALFYITQTP